jgi:hypothetical protein
VVIVTSGLAAGSLLLGAAFGLNALAKDPGAAARTGNGVTIGALQAEAHNAHTSAVVADVSFIVAAAAAAGALTLYLTTPRPAPSRGASPPGAVAIAPGLVQVRF